MSLRHYTMEGYEPIGGGYEPIGGGGDDQSEEGEEEGPEGEAKGKGVGVGTVGRAPQPALVIGRHCMTECV